MNITKDVISKVSDYVSDKNTSIDAILDRLNERNTDNPLAQKKLKKPLEFSAMASVISKESLAKVMTYIHLGEVISDIRSQNYDAAGLWVYGLMSADIITEAEAEAIRTIMSAEVPDPDWVPRLSWSEINLGEQLTMTDMNDIANYGKWK